VRLARHDPSRGRSFQRDKTGVAPNLGTWRRLASMPFELGQALIVVDRWESCVYAVVLRHEVWGRNAAAPDGRWWESVGRHNCRPRPDPIAQTGRLPGERGSGRAVEGGGWPGSDASGPAAVPSTGLFQEEIRR